MLKEKLRLQVLNGTLADYKNYMAGSYRGYYILVDFHSPNYIVNIHASAPSEESLLSVQSFLDQHRNQVKQLTKTELRKNSITLIVATPNLAKNLPSALNSAIEPLISFLSDLGYTSGCGNCGNSNEPTSCYEVNGLHHYLCDTCAREVEASLQENQQNIKAQKSMLFPGLIGAFLGTLIGAVLWVLIYQLGYIAGIAGAVTTVCAFKGYEMLGKHLDKKGVIFSVIISIIMIYFANRVAWAFSAYSELKEYFDITFFDVYRALGVLIKEADATANYYGDLVIGYILTIVCSVGTIIRTLKASVGSYSMKKM